MSHSIALALILTILRRQSLQPRRIYQVAVNTRSQDQKYMGLYVRTIVQYTLRIRECNGVLSYILCVRAAVLFGQTAFSRFHMHQEYECSSTSLRLGACYRLMIPTYHAIPCPPALPAFNREKRRPKSEKISRR